MKSLYSAIAAAVLLSACSSTGTVAPVENPVQNGSRSGQGGPGSGNGIGSNGIGVSPATVTPAQPGNAAANGQGGAAGGQGADTQVGKSVYFDYNEYAVKPEYQDMLKQNFGTPRARGNGSFRLEGNADERGSAEYNLALGQKRAESVKRQLELLGVPEAQLEAVSLGSEKPRATCHEERCWAENRRVDLMRQGR